MSVRAAVVQFRSSCQVTRKRLPSRVTCRARGKASLPTVNLNPSKSVISPCPLKQRKLMELNKLGAILPWYAPRLPISLSMKGLLELYLLAVSRFLYVLPLRNVVNSTGKFIWNRAFAINY